MKKRIHVYFSGRVHGVGFRFTAVEIAQDLDIVGWVRNLPDGRVEIIAEAQEDALSGFLSRIEDTFSRYIQDVQLEWLDAGGEFNNFKVEF